MLQGIDNTDVSEAVSESVSESDLDTKLNPATWAEYLESIPTEQRDAVSKLYSAENQKLIAAVKATREERDLLQRDLRVAAKQAGALPALQETLNKQADELQNANKKSAFYENAILRRCSNPALAWAFAKSENLFSGDGEADWKNIELRAPELFAPARPAATRGAAGAGANNTVQKQTVTDWIRQQSGIIARS